MIRLLLLLMIQAPVPPQAPPMPPAQDTPKLSQWDAYVQLRSRALRDNVPLVVGVGYHALTPTGWLGCRCDDFPGIAKGTVVGVPHRGELYRVDLPASASAAQIREAVDRLRASLSPRVQAKMSLVNC